MLGSVKLFIEYSKTRRLSMEKDRPKNGFEVTFCRGCFVSLPLQISIQFYSFAFVHNAWIV